jgi:hypothetical protein
VLLFQDIIKILLAKDKGKCYEIKFKGEAKKFPLKKGGACLRQAGVVFKQSFRVNL